MSELQQSLINAGYILYKSEGNILFHSTKYLYQKKVADEGGPRYCINAYWYNYQEIKNIKLKESIQFEVQYRLARRDFIDVTFSTKDINKAEKQFDKLWDCLDTVYC